VQAFKLTCCNYRTNKVTIYSQPCTQSCSFICLDCEFPGAQIAQLIFPATKPASEHALKIYANMTGSDCCKPLEILCASCEFQS